MIVQDYYVDGTDFEIINCPKYSYGLCVYPDHTVPCKSVKDCILKAHMVCLSATIAVCPKGSAAEIGAKACFNSFLVEREDNEIKTK